MMNLLTYVVLPIYTVLLAAGYNWFTFNFSVIGYSLGRRDAFLFWGLLVGICYGRTLSSISGSLTRLHLLSARGQTLFKVFIPLDLFILFCAVTTPYLPQVFPLKAILHILFAAAAAILLLLFLTGLTWRLSRKDPKCSPSFYCCLAIAAVSVLLFLLAGIVSSSLEIFFTLSTIWLTDYLKKQLLNSAQYPISSPLCSGKTESFSHTLLQKHAPEGRLLLLSRACFIII